MQHLYAKNKIMYVGLKNLDPIHQIGGFKKNGLYTVVHKNNGFTTLRKSPDDRPNWSQYLDGRLVSVVDGQKVKYIEDQNHYSKVEYNGIEGWLRTAYLVEKPYSRLYKIRIPDGRRSIALRKKPSDEKDFNNNKILIGETVRVLRKAGKYYFILSMNGSRFGWIKHRYLKSFEKIDVYYDRLIRHPHEITESDLVLAEDVLKYYYRQYGGIDINRRNVVEWVGILDRKKRSWRDDFQKIEFVYPVSLLYAYMTKDYPGAAAAPPAVPRCGITVRTWNINNNIVRNDDEIDITCYQEISLSHLDAIFQSSNIRSSFSYNQGFKTFGLDSNRPAIDQQNYGCVVAWRRDRFKELPNIMPSYFDDSNQKYHNARQSYYRDPHHDRREQNMTLDIPYTYKGRPTGAAAADIEAFKRALGFRSTPFIILQHRRTRKKYAVVSVHAQVPRGIADVTQEKGYQLLLSLANDIARSGSGYKIRGGETVDHVIIAGDFNMKFDVFSHTFVRDLDRNILNPMAYTRDIPTNYGLDGGKYSPATHDQDRNAFQHRLDYILTTTQNCRERRVEGSCNPRYGRDDIVQDFDETGKQRTGPDGQPKFKVAAVDHYAVELCC